MEARQPFDATGQSWHEARGNERRLAGSRGSDDVDLALAAAQPANDAVDLDVAPEKLSGITLGERAHARIRAWDRQ